MRRGSSDEVSGSVMTTTVTWKKEDVGIDQKDKQRKVVVFFWFFLVLQREWRCRDIMGYTHCRGMSVVGSGVNTLDIKLLQVI